MKRNDLTCKQKLACIHLFPEDAKKDKDWIVRIEAYRALWYTEETRKDKHWEIRREAYRSLWYTEEAFKDKDWEIRQEAEIYFEVKEQSEGKTEVTLEEIADKMWIPVEKLKIKK